MAKESTKSKKAKSDKTKSDKPTVEQLSEAFEGVEGVEVGEFKGKPTLTFGGEARFPFTFGAGKAKLLVGVAEAMGPEEFVEALRVLVAVGASAEEK